MAFSEGCGAINGEAIRLETLPQGKEYMINTRNQVLHLRSYAPEKAEDIKALVIFIHGYGGHVNSREKVRLGLAMPPAGLAMVLLDLPGHGYSQGERAYIRHYTHWIDDYSQLLEAVAGGGFTEKSKGHVCLSPEHLERLKQVPLFLSGESLGGGLTVFMGLTLYQRQEYEKYTRVLNARKINIVASWTRKHALLPRFKGVCLVAPAIQGNVPPAPVVLLLRYLVEPLIPRTQIPDFLETVKNPEKVWKSQTQRELVARDEWGKPGGIGWGHNMKFRMGLQMMDMVAWVYARLSDVKFPFLIMHDPEDAIVQFGPSRELLEKASTPSDDPRDRELKEMDGWLHDLLTNCPDQVIGNLTDWILYQTSRST